jgi:hypothetical protein
MGDVSVLVAERLGDVTCHAHRTARTERDSTTGEEWTFGGMLIGAHGFCTASSTSCPYEILPPLQIGQMLRLVTRLANESHIQISLVCGSYKRATDGDGSSLFQLPPSWIALGVNSATDAQMLQSKLIEWSSLRATFSVVEVADGSAFHVCYGRRSCVWRLVVYSNAGISHGVRWKWVPEVGISVPLALVSKDSSLTKLAGLACERCTLCPPPLSLGSELQSGYLYSAGMKDTTAVRRSTAD